MATLQKFKLLATQCAVAGSPTRSPAASPVVHLRRRKTLRMLLGRGGRGGCDGGTSSDRGGGSSPEKRKELSVRRKLKDLFVSSPPASAGFREGFLPSVGAGGRVRRSGGRSQRALTATFRQRLLRRPWRPVLGAIPE